MSVNAWLTRALEEDTRELLESGAAGTAGVADPSRRDEEVIPAGAAEAAILPTDGESRRPPAETGPGGKPGPIPDSGPDPAQMLRRRAGGVFEKSGVRGASFLWVEKPPFTKNWTRVKMLGQIET